MRIFGRTMTDRSGKAVHRVEVMTFDDDEDPAFVAMCTCGKVSLPFRTADEATRWGRDHGAEVAERVRVLTGEGGVGWECMFCGSVVEEAPLRISVSWTDEGVDDEQWHAAHRACLVNRMSSGEQLTPRFRVPGSEAQVG